MTNKEKVSEWFAQHPDGTQKQCTVDLGISKSTVSRICKVLFPEKRREPKKQPTPEPELEESEKKEKAKKKESDRTEKITITIAPDKKKWLNIICSVRGVSIADWIESHIIEDAKGVHLPDQLPK